MTTSIRRLRSFDASELVGAPFTILLSNSVDEKFNKQTNETISHIVPNVSGLLSAVSVARVLHPLKLNGNEVRFLRRGLRMKAKELASEIATTPEQLSRIENGKQTITLAYERLLRARVILGHIDTAKFFEFQPEELFTMDLESVWPAGEKLKFSFQVFHIDHNDDAAKASHQGVDEDHKWKRKEQVA